MKKFAIVLMTMLCALTARAQEFVDLTPSDVSIDTILPYYTKSIPLPQNYSDSVYRVKIIYPEFIPFTEKEVQRFKQLCNDSLPALPAVDNTVSVERKRASLDISFMPLVFRDGKYQKLVSFKLEITSTPAPMKVKALASASGRYTAHSVLASGTWVKIRIPSSGIYQITSDLIRKAGFSDINKVKLYGYGGALVNEVLTGTNISKYDDLKEVPTYVVNGKKLFYAQGPISWEQQSSKKRTFNPYSSYGYYFITQSDDTPQTYSSDTTFAASFYPANEDFHTLYEVDDFAWFTGGRELFDSKLYTVNSANSYTLTTPGLTTNGTLTVALTAEALAYATIAINDSTLGTLNVPAPSTYDDASETTTTYIVSNLKASNKVTITQTSGGKMRLDYLSLYFNKPRALPSLTSTSFDVPEYVETISNQDLHADSAFDMIIIVPKNGQLTEQAKRLQTIHEQKDDLRVKIIPADKLYNEFSSGTPDATAYRKYLKMLYDRASSDADMPRYLLLMGDCAWDNRMKSSAWTGSDPDDYLLCFESYDSFSETDCYVMEDYFGLLDDGEGGSLTTSDKPDVGVGRIPARTAAEAKVMVDKTISYINNENAGSWQNEICFMGDDGNDNLHMGDAEAVAKMVENNYPGYIVKRVMWDAYTRVSTSTGNTYPEATSTIKQQQNNGALMMNYTGHGAPYCLSHEQVLKTADFAAFSSPRLPLWLTASCDIMPFDGQAENIGETAIFNSKGGAVAFFGTTRTVYSFYNRRMNLQFTNYALGMTSGKKNKLGDAVRLAKNALINTRQDVTANKLQYALLGDPALALATPSQTITIDSINNEPATSTSMPTLKAGSKVRIKGHIVSNNTTDTSFNGNAYITVRDSREKVIGNNYDNEADTAFWYYDRLRTLFKGSNAIKNGTFSFDFTMPMDINYSSSSGLINAYALSTDNSTRANGYNNSFIVGGTSVSENDSIGPSIYCYLNSSSFMDGDAVNKTPYFYAELNDDDGINATGNGIGHDLELIIDGKTETTYVLNDYFSNDFGTYTSGTLGFSIPELSTGTHKLKFRAWDVLNNSSTAELSFNVVNGLEPDIISASCTKNPATTTTTFIITHDRSGSDINVEVEVFDIAGRLLWRHDEEGTSTSNAYTVDWDLMTSGGEKLTTGVYIYRVKVASDGSRYVSKAKKLIVINNI